MIKTNNYICILGWMCLDKEHGGLDLKGNDLIIFAIIYGFCLMTGLYFNGSLEYLSEWVNGTRLGVIKNLTNLQDLGLISKIEAAPTNKYFVNHENLPGFNKKEESKSDVNLVTESSDSVKQSLHEGGKQSSHNNIVNNINNNNINSYERNKEFLNLCDSVISYFNNICHSNFKYNNNATQRCIRKLLDQGYTELDMFKVIDYKYSEWGEHPVLFSNGLMSQTYLRPQTLFSDKFESYLNSANISATAPKVKLSGANTSCSVSKPVTSPRSDFIL